MMDRRWKVSLSRREIDNERERSVRGKVFFFVRRRFYLLINQILLNEARWKIYIPFSFENLK